MAPHRILASILPYGLTLIGLLSIHAWADEGPASTKSIGGFAEITGYEIRRIEGWQVRISQRLLEKDAEKTKRAIELLGPQLQKIKHDLPPDVVKKLMAVEIWMSPPYPGVQPTAEYHPNVDWLIHAGRSKELARCVELTNVRIFERECERMPMMIMHELAHAYHDQVLGFDEPRIRAAYDAAKSSGIYESVERKNAANQRAYAITNPIEYFAESTESFFGLNDFFPFDRQQLQDHDPRMYDLLRRIWKQE